MREESVTLAMALSGAAEEDKVWITTLCAAVYKRLLATLRADAREEDYREALICAGAYLIWADYIAYKAENSAESFKAGDVTVNRRKDVQGAQRERREMAARLMRPYVEDRAFVFAEV